MRNKFAFLTKDSLKKKINTKSFKIVNIILFIIIAGLLNLDSIVKSFGGDFENEVKILIIDEVNVYDDLEALLKNSYFDVLDSYNAKIEKTDKTLEELEKEIKENMKKEKEEKRKNKKDKKNKKHKKNKNNKDTNNKEDL